jgi:hypothetical protein
MPLLAAASVTTPTSHRMTSRRVTRAVGFGAAGIIPACAQGPPLLPARKICAETYTRLPAHTLVTMFQPGPYLAGPNGSDAEPLTTSPTEDHHANWGGPGPLPSTKGMWPLSQDPDTCTHDKRNSANDDRC